MFSYTKRTNTAIVRPEQFFFLFNGVNIVHFNDRCAVNIGKNLKKVDSSLIYSMTDRRKL